MLNLRRRRNRLPGLAIVVVSKRQRRLQLQIHTHTLKRTQYIWVHLYMCVYIHRKLLQQQDKWTKVTKREIKREIGRRKKCSKTMQICFCFIFSSIQCLSTYAPFFIPREGVMRQTLKLAAAVDAAGDEWKATLALEEGKKENQQKEEQKSNKGKNLQFQERERESTATQPPPRPRHIMHQYTHTHVHIQIIYSSFCLALSHWQHRQVNAPLRHQNTHIHARTHSNIRHT